MTAARTWLVPRYGTFSALTNISLGGDPVVARNAFGQGTTWFSGRYRGEGTGTRSPIPRGYAGVAVLKFAAYENGTDGLLDAVRDGLPAWVQAVQYDAEGWDLTPPIEKGAWLRNPFAGVSYAELFCRTAHDLGFPVVLTPSLDLCGNKPNPAYPGLAPQYPVSRGERNYEAFVRYRLASAARWLSPGDVYEFQSQALETDSSRFESVTAAVHGQVRDVSRDVTFLAGIGRTKANWDGATAAQLTAAARSVAPLVAGYWPNVDEDAARVRTMIGFLRNLGY
ncbi:MAG TPA: hypothetical protein VMC83_27915 [Streptosporangiaceae bacterium]|nr:hypothetical protein [Streptosporangiaceae bacterium]